MECGIIMGNKMVRRGRIRDGYIVNNGGQSVRVDVFDIA